MGYFHRDIASPHAQLEIAHRRIDDAQQVQLFGFNRTIDIAYETVWNNGGGIYSFPGSALTMTCVSSSASDTMPILIQGLDINYEPITDVVTLDGTTGVDTSIGFYRINAVTILSGNNVGNISVTNGGTTYGYIEATFGTTQGIIYTTPADSALYVFTADFTSGTVNPNKYMFSRAMQRSSNGRVLHFWESTFATNIEFNVKVPFRIPPKTDFTIEAKSSSSTNELSIYIGAVLLQEDL
jgi:hypothetical protein